MHQWEVESLKKRLRKSVVRAQELEELLALKEVIAQKDEIIRLKKELEEIDQKHIAILTRRLFDPSTRKIKEKK